jgi:hypothetical protein
LPALRAEPCAFGHRHATGRAGHARTLPVGKGETAADGVRTRRNLGRRSEGAVTKVQDGPFSAEI